MRIRVRLTRIVRRTAMSGKIDRMIVEADHDYDREIIERLTTDLTP